MLYDVKSRKELVRAHNACCLLVRSGVILGWTLSMPVMYARIYSAGGITSVQHRQNPWDTAAYDGFHCIARSTAVAWLVYACRTGHAARVKSSYRKHAASGRNSRVYATHKLMEGSSVSYFILNYISLLTWHLFASPLSSPTLFPPFL